MIRSEQNAVFEAMADPGFYPHNVRQVRQRETHISRVFLTGDFVYKVKKAVDLGFVDYTTLEKRQRFCRRETELNRRLSSNVYLGVVGITRDRNRYAIGGRGETVEYAVKMRQLPAEATLERQLKAQRIGNNEIVALAEKLAGFYATTDRGAAIDARGSWEVVRGNCEENFTQVEPFLGKLLDERMLQIIRAAARSHLQRKRPLFEKRVADGRIRDCHGDLRSGHIYFENGIQIVDCIEFNDRFRYGDVASDLAFLAMDLDAEGFPEAARALMSKYVATADDPDAYALLDFYKSYRAMVRAKVACLRLTELKPDTDAYRRTRREAEKYLTLAYQYAVQFSRPTMWVFSGLPASGKSTIAAELGRTLGINVLSSDRVRKQLFGLPAETARVQAFEEGIYSREAAALTYGRLLLLAQEELETGQSVILDATFSSARQREEALRLARDMDVNVLFVECTARPKVLIKRLRRRQFAPSVSDARVQHFRKLSDRFEPLTDISHDLRIKIDTEEDLLENLNRILAHDNCLLSKRHNGGLTG